MQNFKTHTWDPGSLKTNMVYIHLRQVGQLKGIQQFILAIPNRVHHAKKKQEFRGKIPHFPGFFAHWDFPGKRGPSWRSALSRIPRFPAKRGKPGQSALSWKIPMCKKARKVRIMLSRKPRNPGKDT